MPRLWPGETVVIAGAGPSLTQGQVDRVRGRARLIVVNTSYRLAPWADLLYGCDPVWWRTYAPDFAGLKVSQDSGACKEFGLLRAPAESLPGLSLDPHRIHQGGNGGYQALNLAVHLGARRVALLGFDMTAALGTHWHGDHPAEMNNPVEGMFEIWRTAFASAVPDLAQAGVEVVNCTPGSALDCFPHGDLEDVFPLADRAAEQAKYHRAYRLPRYAMGAARMADAVRDLAALPDRGSYLDVGCGRGEMLDHAAGLGFTPVHGVDVVPALIDGKRVVHGEAHRLPFPTGSFDTVTLFDVIEHLLPGDDELACGEMARVARKHILLTANNRPSALPDGTDLHINKRPYDEWDALFRNWFPRRVTWIKGTRSYVSEAWRVDL